MTEPVEPTEMMHALSAWAKAQGRGFRGGGIGPGAYDFVQLHYRPDPTGPEAQITFHADMVDGRPVIRVALPDPPHHSARSRKSALAAHQIVTLGSTELPRREPAATCDACGAVGTIGRAVRTDERGDATEVHRFCVDCWPEQSARYRARWNEEDRRWRDRFFRTEEPGPPGGNRGMAFEAATWHAALELIRGIERTMIAPVPPSTADLERLAEQIRQAAPELEGEMPFEIEAFLHRYEGRADH